MPEAMSESRGLKGLQEWGRKVTEGYRDVKVENLTSSWRDGLAFCAIIHHFRPDLLDYDSLSKENAFENNSLAFSVAEKQLGIPALLDASDMVQCIQPDRLSIATYLSQLYRHFEGGANKKYGYSKALLKRPVGIKGLGTEPPSKVASIGSEDLSGRKYEFCQSCKHRVFILERLVIDGKLYHRTCFKCYRCNALLKPGAYNEGETPGLYECTVCPQDEENEFKPSTEAVIADAAKSSSIVHSDSEETTDKNENDSEQIINKDLNDLSKPNENMVLSKSFQEARMFFLKNDLDSSSQTDIKCESLKQVRRNSDLKTYNISCLTSTPKTLQQTSESDVTLPHQSTGQLVDQQSVSSNTVVTKPPIGRKPDFLHISKYSKPTEYSKLPNKTEGDTEVSSIRKNSFDTNRQSATTNSEIVTDSTQGYKSVYRRQLKPLKIEIPGNIDLNNKTPSSLSSNSPLSPHLDLPVIRSPNYQTPLLSKSLTRTKSDDNFQKTQRLSLLSEALNSLPKRNESAEDLDKVLHRKWSKQSNYLLPTTKSPSENVSVLDDSEGIKVKNTDTVECSSLSTSEVFFSAVEDNNKTNDTLIESCVDSDARTKVKDGEIHSSQDTEAESLDKEAVKSNSEMNKVRIQEFQVEDSKSDCLDSNLQNTSLDFLQDKDLGSLTDTHSTCTANTEESENREEEYPDDLNPFGDDDSGDSDDQNEEYPDSLNPFDSSEDEELSSFSKASTLPVTSANTSHTTKKGNYDPTLNPFSSDDDDDDEGNVSDMHSSLKSQTISSGYPNSFSSLSSESPTGTKRKKKPPPPPPTVKEVFDKSPNTIKSRSNSLKPSPKTSQKRTAPKPPLLGNNMPHNVNKVHGESFSEKVQKGKSNVNLTQSSHSNNNMQRQWKKKKRPAPSVPVPPRRQIKMIPLNEIQTEMAEIEVKQQELENQGRELELLIRDCNQESDPTMEEEEAIMQLFELVNQKNILFRRQAELMYIKRSQRLEEEQVELEFQIRCLMTKPASKKTEEDTQREEELLQRLIDVVEQRNEIVDSIEMDRKSREVQEDQSIQEQTEQKFIEIKEKWSGTMSNKKKEKHKNKKDKKKGGTVGEEGANKSHKQKKKKSWF